MSATTSIEWTDRTWNPVRGCSLVSPGCTNCYAMKFAHRFSGPGGRYEGLTRNRDKGGPVWTGKVALVRDQLTEPMRWRKPQRVFVNSMADLFHEDVPDEYIDAVFAVMAFSHHTYQVLTKRAERLPRWAQGAHERVERAAGNLALAGHLDIKTKRIPWWPLPNVWMGVSVEDQQRADERIPHLVRVAAAVRFLSCEPLLGAVSFRWLKGVGYEPGWRERDEVQSEYDALKGIGWVIVGGESGPGARPFNVEWGRSIVRQCRAAGVPVFWKQMGSHVITRNDDSLAGGLPDDDWNLADPDGQVEHDLDGTRDGYQGAPVRVRLRDRKGGDPEEWRPVDRVREWPKAGR